MRKWKIITIKQDEIDWVRCDLCGVDITCSNMACEIDLPCGDYGESAGVDMCEDCARQKLLPWLEQEGFKR